MGLSEVIIKYFNSWQHFGTVCMLSKAWEKIVIDKHRFRANVKREVPIFPLRKNPNIKGVDEKSVPYDEKMTICYLIHYFFPDKTGGTERFVLNVAKEQQRLGNSVRVITLGKRPLKQYSNTNTIKDMYWENFMFDGIPVTQMRYKRAPKGLYYDRINDDEKTMAAFAENYFHENKIDVVHAAYPQPFASFLDVCKKKSIPYLVTMTDFNIFCHYATMVSKRGMFCRGSQFGKKCSESCHTYGIKDFQQRYKKAESLLSNADYLTVPSEFVAQIIENEFQEIKVNVIPHGISEVFTEKYKRTKTKKFMYAGTLSDLKGVTLLLKAFLKLQDKDLSLEIYGEGESSYVNRLKKLAKGDERITFCGGVSAAEMPNVYQNADCVVIPSVWFETYNFVLREALACGCLVVASNMGAMPEAVREGKNGFIFESGSVNKLYAALEEARLFDWNLYKPIDFPTISEEGSKYNVVYHKMLVGSDKDA